MRAAVTRARPCERSCSIIGRPSAGSSTIHRDDVPAHPGSTTPDPTMITSSLVRKKLESGQPVFGPLINFHSPWLVDLTGIMGFDFVLLDAEHGPMSLENIEIMVRAAEAAGITALARVPANVPHEILRFLDIGVMGVQVPQLNSALDARRRRGCGALSPPRRARSRDASACGRLWLADLGPRLHRTRQSRNHPDGNGRDQRGAGKHR